MTRHATGFIGRIYTFEALTGKPELKYDTGMAHIELKNIVSVFLHSSFPPPPILLENL